MLKISKPLSLFSILLVLIISIPNAHSQTLDEETCLSLISAEQVQSISGYDKTLNASIINANLENLNEGIISGCVVTFEREGLDFGLTVVATVSDSDRTSQSVYEELFSASHQMGVEVIEGNNGPWIYHLVEVRDNGIDSFLASIKDNIQIGINAPQTDFQIETSAVVEILKVVQTNIDKLEISESIPIIITNTPTINENLVSPLEQFKNNIPYSKIECNIGLHLTQKHDGSPACVKPETISELIKRGWANEIIIKVQSRGILSDSEDKMHSDIGKMTITLDDFKNTLSEPYDIDTLFSKFGTPHKDIGSGIHVYVYELDDSTQIWIGYTDHILYVTHLDPDGNILEELFVENKN
ncbi:hypothetical protein K0U27_05600 [archaeon]|nr:hypothetical protein [archaeon]